MPTTINRIDTCFKKLKQENKCALITFITAGDPIIKDILELMLTMANNGVDIIELGVPFSDPMADGATIQRSSDRAVKAGVNFEYILNLVTSFRQHNQHTSIVLMGYSNSFNTYVQKYGQESFALNLVNAGVDAILQVDMPPEHDNYREILFQHGIYTIYLIAPTTTKKRIDYINQYANGYIYYVALKGVTGASNLKVEELIQTLPQLKQNINLPCAVGFGIDNPYNAGIISKNTDAIVIGSKIINLLEQNQTDKQNQVIAQFLQDIQRAML